MNVSLCLLNLILCLDVGTDHLTILKYIKQLAFIVSLSMSTVNVGAGLLNRTIDALPFELHIPTLSGNYQFCGPGTRLEERLALGQRGINQLDKLCLNHDLAYSKHKDSQTRTLADKQLANSAWKLFKSKDTPLSEKVASWIVTTMMNLKSKIGGGNSSLRRKTKRLAGRVGLGRKVARSSRGKPISFGSMLKHAKAAIRGAGVRSSKTVESDGRKLRSVAMTAIKAVRNLRKGRRLRRPSIPRTLPLPKSGGVLPLLPIFAGLSALGSLTGGVAGVIKSLEEAKDASRRLSELQRHNKSMEEIELKKGKGLFLKPHPKGGLGLHMKPYTKYVKNC